MPENAPGVGTIWYGARRQKQANSTGDVLISGVDADIMTEVIEIGCYFN